ncbi:MAG: prepilin peptidase [Clostridia bacterium]|nr:prepilin peptidase [Clostridia bacterium]
MNTIFFIILFIMGTLFGSFLTLATYRIPLNKDITHEHSFCPNCNHKLEFMDLIPVLSYLCLGGKCRYCKKKISPRYITIELLTGLCFIGIAYALEMSVYMINAVQIIEYAIAILYLIFLFLIAGIDAENKKIDKRVLIYGITVACINIIYQYIYNIQNGYKYNLNRVIIYLFLTIILILVDLSTIKKTNKYDYMFDLLILTIIMCLFTYEITTIMSIACCILIIGFIVIINKLFNKNKKRKKNRTKFPIAFYLVTSNIIMFIISYLYMTYVF